MQSFLSAPGRKADRLNPQAVVELAKNLEEVLDALHPAFRMENPDRSWDEEIPSLPLKRAYIHLLIHGVIEGKPPFFPARLLHMYSSWSLSIARLPIPWSLQYPLMSQYPRKQAQPSSSITQILHRPHHPGCFSLIPHPHLLESIPRPIPPPNPPHQLHRHSRPPLEFPASTRRRSTQVFPPLHGCHRSHRRSRYTDHLR